MAARAVRKAVSSSAAIKAYGSPEGLSSVKDPRGVMLCRLGTDVSVDCVDAIEGAWEEAGVEAVEACDNLELLREEMGERIGVLLEGEVEGGMAMVTIFTPRLVLVLAGMNRVACWLRLGIKMRLGWLQLAQPLVS